MNVISRDEALVTGLKTYFTGLPCKRGHVVERRVGDRDCIQCASDRIAEWQRANPEKANARTARWAKANPEKVRQKRYAWIEANAERHRENVRAHTADYRGLRNAVAGRYRASKLRALPCWSDRTSVEMIYRAAEVARVIWNDVEVDHIVPLQGKEVSGLHVHNNLQLIAAKANQAKSNRFEGVSK